MPNWIRGVNLGGWLVLERFITPYLFAITTCHLSGNFCVHPGQTSIGMGHDECDWNVCPPVLQKRSSSSSSSSTFGEDDIIMDFPRDQASLVQQFDDPHIASQFLDLHYDHFVTRQDVTNLREAGVTHLRVPLPSSILANSSPEVSDHSSSSSAWLYFLRLVGWCRQDGIQVWPDLHIIPDGTSSSCQSWNVNQTLDAVQMISNEIAKDGLGDVVRGFGIFNSPKHGTMEEDCNDDLQVVRDYASKALHIVRSTLGNDTSIIMGDMDQNATMWNDGWWDDVPNTFLDSHYNQVFAKETRNMSPRQHIAMVCGKNARDVNACCYSDYPNNTQPNTNNGIRRIVGQWSAAYDILPIAMEEYVMKGIAMTGEAPYFNRTMSEARKKFLQHFCEAQMVTYEAANVGVSSGWFYGTLKTEGGAFAEWDFLRGVREGWIPKMAAPNVSSVDLYGRCEDIIFRTDDDESIVDEYPDSQTTDSHKNWHDGEFNIDDDLVSSHGDSLLKQNEPGTAKETADTKESDKPSASESSVAYDDDSIIADEGTTDDGITDKKVYESPIETKKKRGHPFFTLGAFALFLLAVKHVFLDAGDRRRSLGYRSVDSTEALTMAV